MSESLELVATCPVGLEPFVERELIELGAESPTTQRGSVVWRGDWRSAFRANLWLRCANRVLIRLGEWGIADDDALTTGAEKLTASLLRGPSERLAGLDGRELLAARRTLSVQASSSGAVISDRRWIAQKIKDGVVDAQRRLLGERSDVDREAADVALRARLVGERVTLYLDLSGEPLDRRGYRVQSVDAPVREHLAAACVMAAEWDGLGAIADPMCGSGTLLIEAAWRRLGWAPSRLRRHWNFEHLSVARENDWGELRDAARTDSVEALGGEPLEIFGLDHWPVAERATRRNLEAAGLDGEGVDPLVRAEIEVADAFDFDAPAERGLVLVNPPYGERVDSPTFDWRRLGDLLKQGYRGWTAVVLAGDERLGKDIGLRPRRRWPVRNGRLEARILVFDLY